jgi:glycosyltransferase involved in cell wall biosynthesis
VAVKVLVMTPYLPHSRVGHGGGVAVRSLTSELARLHDVRVLSLIRPGEEALIADVEALGVAVTGVPFLDQSARGWQRAELLAQRLPAAARAVVHRYPFYVAKYGAQGLVKRIVAEVRAFAPDVVQIEYLQLALPLRELRRERDRRGASRGTRPRPRLVLNSHELSSLPRRRRAARAENRLSRAWLVAEARSWERLQVDATHWADATLCVTPQDHALYASLGGRGLHTLPLGVDTREVVFRPRQDAAPARALPRQFQHPPNVRPPACWSTSSGRDCIRSFRLGVAPGRSGSDAFVAGLPARGGPDVRGLGCVDDLGALFSSCSRVLAPLTEGGGIKIKILEAMGRGLPVVTTPIGAEGITEAADETVWLAAGLEDFPAEALAAATHPEEARRRAARARRLIDESFSWQAIAARLTAVYERI